MDSLYMGTCLLWKSFYISLTRHIPFDLVRILYPFVLQNEIQGGILSFFPCRPGKIRCGVMNGFLTHLWLGGFYVVPFEIMRRDVGQVSLRCFLPPRTLLGGSG
jgi:hypothetical protein